MVNLNLSYIHILLRGVVMSMAPGLKWGCACADCGGRRVRLCMCGWTPQGGPVDWVEADVWL